MGLLYNRVVGLIDVFSVLIDIWGLIEMTLIELSCWSD